MEYSFVKFDLNKLCENPCINIVGKRGSGKTQLIRNIVEHQYDAKKFDKIIVISPMEKHNPFYDKFVDVVHDKYSSEIIEQAFKYHNEHKDEHLMIVFDDCITNKLTWVNDNLFRDLMFNARHLNISYILSTLNPKSFCPDIRTNVDYVFLFAFDYKSDIDALYKNYAGCFRHLITLKEHV